MLLLVLARAAFERLEPILGVAWLDEGDATPVPRGPHAPTAAAAAAMLLVLLLVMVVLGRLEGALKPGNRRRPLHGAPAARWPVRRRVLLQLLVCMAPPTSAHHPATPCVAWE